MAKKVYRYREDSPIFHALLWLRHSEAISDSERAEVDSIFDRLHRGFGITREEQTWLLSLSRRVNGAFLSEGGRYLE